MQLICDSNRHNIILFGHLIRNLVVITVFSEAECIEKTVVKAGAVLSFISLQHL